MDESLLTKKYDLVKLNVAGSTQISSRTAAVIAKLELTPTDGKPVIVVLTAKARVASKLISIVEIAKRELAAKGRSCFQYNVLVSEMTEIERSPRRTTAMAAGHNSKQAGSDSDEAFETMGAYNETGLKKRQVPVMTIYLSTVSVKELKTEFG